MKKTRIITLLLLCLAIVCKAEPTDISTLENVIYTENVSCDAGSTLTLSIKMKNAIPMTGFQFDIVLPTGISVTEEDDYLNVELSTERTTAKKHNYFDSVEQLDGSVRVMASSTKSYTFEGTDGEVATIEISVADNVAGGVYPIIIKNIVMSDATSKTYEVEKVESTITIKESPSKIADRFKTDHATILGKTTSTVASSDLDAINAALDAYNSLDDEVKSLLATEKSLLDSLKAKAEEIKAAEEADAAATAEANKFKTDNAAILAKTTATVTSSDLTSINKALEDYNSLSSAAKAKVATEKSLLDNLKTKAEEFKAAEEADAAATAEANQFKTDNAAILAKTTATVTSSDIDAINAALEAYNQLSAAAKAKVATEKSLLDALKAKAEELKAAEEAAEADVTATVNKFLTDNSAVLGKTMGNVTSSDLDAIYAALNDYNNLSDEAKALLTEEKTLLDNLKTKAERIKKYDINGDNRITITDVTELIDVIVNQ